MPHEHPLTESLIRAIQIGRPRMFDGAEPWLSAIEKAPIEGPVQVTTFGLRGDAQADGVNHGGPDKAICAHPFEHYAFWIDRERLASLPTGAFGENFTLEALVEEVVCVGDVFTTGSIVIQISQPRQPCWKLARKWAINGFAERVVESNRTGWYFRVLQEGIVHAGNSLTLVDRPHPGWTIATANDVMHRGGHDVEASLALAAVPALSRSWKDTLGRRATLKG